LLRPTDGPLHRSDGSHRELCPDPRVPHEAWVAQLQAHRDEHRTDLDAGYMLAPSGAMVGRPSRRGTGRR
jgi:hypothetical protein